MNNKKPIVTVRDEDISIVIQQDTVNVQPAYNISIAREHHTDVIRVLSVDDMEKLRDTIEAYLTILK